MKTVRLGLLGLGHVGQAVARTCDAGAAALHAWGLAPRVVGALVRDAQRPRRCPPVPRLTTNPEAFLRGRYDVVIEVLGGIEPARSLVARVLGRGVPIVTANKSLIAAHGDDLAALAGRRSTQLRYEASVLAGVPLLGALGRRPLVGAGTRISGILNGTTNTILAGMERGATPLADALREAQAAGLCEPDPTADLGGRDAAEKLVVLLRESGMRVLLDDIERTDLRGVEPGDLTAAQELGGCVRPLAFAEARGDAVACWVGPGFVQQDHPLAAVTGTTNAVRLDGRFVNGITWTGPGAGPAVTAATILDDVAEIVAGAVVRPRPPAAPSSGYAPDTPWFVRLALPARAPADAVAAALGACGARCRAVLAGSDRAWALVDACSRGRLVAALAPLRPAPGAFLSLRVLEA